MALSAPAEVTSICHDKNSTYYAQTKKFTAYATINAFIASGGKLPKT